MSSLAMDLASFLLIFACCWVLFFASHALAAALGLVSGVGQRLVALAVVVAGIAAVLSWWLAGGLFSGSAVHALASLTAPFAYLGFCGIYFLIGPVTVDRSITLSILSAFANSGTKGLSRGQLQGCVPFDRIFEKRLRELEMSGTLTLGDGVRVTERGERILGFYKWLARVFRVNFQ
jgi:hypothetical protein